MMTKHFYIKYIILPVKNKPPNILMHFIMLAKNGLIKIV